MLPGLFSDNEQDFTLHIVDNSEQAHDTRPVYC